MHTQSLKSFPTLVTLLTVACQAPLSMGFSKQECSSGMPFPPPGDLPDAVIEPMSLIFPVLAGKFFNQSPQRVQKLLN